MRRILPSTSDRMGMKEYKNEKGFAGLTALQYGEDLAALDITDDERFWLLHNFNSECAQYISLANFSLEKRLHFFGELLILKLDLKPNVPATSPPLLGLLKEEQNQGSISSLASSLVDDVRSLCLNDASAQPSSPVNDASAAEPSSSPPPPPSKIAVRRSTRSRKPNVTSKNEKKCQNEIVEEFHMRLFNVVVARSILEEGLDVQSWVTCLVEIMCLVGETHSMEDEVVNVGDKFDLFENVSGWDK
ncbi:uncharacterized protein LOC131662132 [Vicia villosa]|uniref:uncharacterized protein LOC131662132 n=1 Tax=Vicia villosa TaxID=3911 RepID=UPI00273C7F81|nr:uncharacterized protein LOC131662132 [Vicia villosa]